MKVYLPNSSKQSLGGGWTFRRNLVKGSKELFEVVDDWKECDIALISGVTMVTRDEMQAIKEAGKKIVLRVDNMPKDSRNRGTAFSRMKDFSKMADYIIFQSKWAMDYVGYWIKNTVEAEAMNTIGKYSIIFNGVDTEYFYFEDNPRQRPENYLYVQYNRDENKRPTEAFYNFAMKSRFITNAKLSIVGNFSPETINYNFDFFNNELVSYQGVFNDPMEMGNEMRRNKYLLFPAFADASPNTVGEALACGMIPKATNKVGGTKEVIQYLLSHKQKTGSTYSIQNMAYQYNEVFKKLI